MPENRIFDLKRTTLPFIFISRGSEKLADIGHAYSFTVEQGDQERLAQSFPSGSDEAQYEASALAHEWVTPFRAEHHSWLSAQTEALRDLVPEIGHVLLRPEHGYEAEFQRLAAQWKAERSSYSSLSRVVMHLAYQQIIGLGAVAVPYVLAELERETDHWFWALRAMTRENPVPEDAVGDMRRMRAIWLEWGRGRGLIE